MSTSATCFLRPKAKGMAVLLQGLLPRLQVGGEVDLLLVRKNDPSILEEVLKIMNLVCLRGLDVLQLFLDLALYLPQVLFSLLDLL